MSKITVELNGDTFLCREAVGSDMNELIAVSTSDGRFIGEMYGNTIPDENDEIEVELFTAELENWLIDNWY